MAESTLLQAKPDAAAGCPTIQVDDLSFAYGDNIVLRDVSMDIRKGEVTAFIGPSGCGKSTLLRCFNRMSDLVEDARITEGRVLLEGLDINHPDINVVALRRRIGMVFQKYNPFPRSIFENVVYGLRIQGMRDGRRLNEAAERSLRAAALWEEVKDRLHESALGLSGGQQQRLCIARAIAVNPSVLLMDEPCSALDPIATAKVEELIHHIKRDYTIVIVTHNMEQAKRVADRTAFFYLGRLIEFDDTLTLFQAPSKRETERYIRGQMG